MCHHWIGDFEFKKKKIQLHDNTSTIYSIVYSKVCTYIIALMLLSCSSLKSHLKSKKEFHFRNKFQMSVAAASMVKHNMC